MLGRTGVLGVVIALAAAHGAPGVGDSYFPNYGNGGYYVSNYDLSVQYNPASNWLTGTAVITAKTNRDLTGFNLDLVGLTVKGITVDDAQAGGPLAATWTRGQHELRVTPSRQLNAGEDFVVTVRYGGVPQTINTSIGPSGVFHTDDGLLVEGEPESAASWFPVNDHPSDKASYTFRVRVPTAYKVVANGVPVGDTTSNGWRTSVWNAPPMASYLATVDVGHWNVNDRTTASGIRIIDAVDPDVAAKANPSLAKEEAMLAFLATQFGDYPFATAGGIVDDHPGIFFALETQTRPIYSSIFFEPFPGQEEQSPGDSVVVHELAHQWFGDSVGLNRWKDIWLNEGFATYAEWLWAEHEGLPDAPGLYTDGLYHVIGDAEPAFWNLRIGDPGPNHLFDEPVYVRGAMTLQALRKRVGDAKFFTILRTWAATNQGGHGTTAQFIALSEQITGRDLSQLFQNWLYSGKRPAAPPFTFPAFSVPSAASRNASPGTAAAMAWHDGFKFRLAHGQR
jgi:aminopeptidase N